MVGWQKGQNGLKRMGVGLDRDTKGQGNLQQSHVTTEKNIHLILNQCSLYIIPQITEVGEPTFAFQRW